MRSKRSKNPRPPSLSPNVPPPRYGAPTNWMDFQRVVVPIIQKTYELYEMEMPWKNSFTFPPYVSDLYRQYKDQIKRGEITPEEWTDIIKTKITPPNKYVRSQQKATRRALLGEPEDMAIYVAEILNQPGRRRERALRATFPGNPDPTKAQSLCNDLNNTMYRKELYELAKDLDLPVTQKTLKAELCKLISEYVTYE